MNIAKRLYRNFLFRTSTRVDAEGRRWVKKDTRGFWVATRRLKRTLPTAEEYLKANPDRYEWGRLWAEHGRSFIPPAYRVCREMIEDDAFLQETLCYTNALDVSLCMSESTSERKGEIRYVEGLAVDPTGAYPHAWVTIDEKVLDPTWPGAYLATYFGVAFVPEWVQQTSRKVGWQGMLGKWDLFSTDVTQELSTRSGPQ
ncbi:MAG: hypothetical protein Q7S50_01695 [bacterium]|nr:hypothetical protein [bacterium]